MSDDSTSTPSADSGSAPSTEQQLKAIRDQQRTEQRAAAMDPRLTPEQRKVQLAQIDARAQAAARGLTAEPAKQPKVRTERKPHRDRRQTQKRLGASGFTDPRTDTERARDDASKGMSQTIRDTKRAQDQANADDLAQRRTAARVASGAVDPKEYQAAQDRARLAEEAAQEPLKLATHKVTELMRSGYSPQHAAELAGFLDGLTDPEQITQAVEVIRGVHQAQAQQAEEAAIVDAVRSGKARLVWNVGPHRGQPLDMNAQIRALARASQKPSLGQHGLQHPNGGR